MYHAGWAGSTPPRVVNGIPQDPFDGLSFTNTFSDAKTKEVQHIAWSKSYTPPASVPVSPN